MDKLRQWLSDKSGRQTLFGGSALLLLLTVLIYGLTLMNRQIREHDWQAPAEDTPSRKAKPVPVSIAGNFTLQQAGGGMWGKASAELSARPPAGVRKYPSYQGRRQLYGTLKLGTFAEKNYPFVYDIFAEGSPQLYFDLNRNGDLTDDGGPIKNRGDGIFAAEIRIPWAQLIKEIRFPGELSIWFFTNDPLWAQNLSTHYNRAQFSGHIQLGGTEYAARIIDGSTPGTANDADFTNDGIHIDLDRNERFDYPGEFFPAGKAIVREYASYRVEVGW